MTINELPRHLPGSPPSARVFNRTADEVDALGLSLTVKRDDPADYREGYLSAGVNRVIQWHSAAAGTGAITGGHAMWSPGQPQFVTIREPGVYVMLLQVRFGIYQYISPTNSTMIGQNLTAESRRWCWITLNGTSLVSDALAQRSVGAVTTGLGTTLQAVAVAALQGGDTIWCLHRSQQLLTATLDTLYGGTYLTVTRVGPAPWYPDEAAGVIRV